jgi:6-phosphogluconolactonase
MEERQLSLGQVRIGGREEIFAAMADHLSTCLEQSQSLIALSGGSTPKAFYDWAVNAEAISPEEAARGCWLVSDERHVPLNDDESNFGHLARGLLDPLGVPEHNRFPFPVQVDPHSGVHRFSEDLVERFGMAKIDLCFLGMGDDGHTASLFPGSPLLEAEVPDRFACVEVPGKGWRFTLTRAGLATCQRICVLVTGAGKAERLRSVFSEPVDTTRQPIQLLGECADRVVWLVDQDAAAQLPDG